MNKMIIKEIKPKYKCESVKGCDRIATILINMKGEGKKKVCEKHYQEFCKAISEIKLENKGE